MSDFTRLPDSFYRNFGVTIPPKNKPVKKKTTKKINSSFKDIYKVAARELANNEHSMPNSSLFNQKDSFTRLSDSIGSVKNSLYTTKQYGKTQVGFGVTLGSLNTEEHIGAAELFGFEINR